MIGLIDNWSGAVTEAISLQILLHEEILMLDASAPDRQDPGLIFHTLGRRQALLTLAALPAALVTSSQVLSTGNRSLDASREYFLSRCAASLTACSHLLNGADMATVDDLIARYRLPLEGIARQQSKFQQAAADLAFQAHTISSITALHLKGLEASEWHRRQALYYADISATPKYKAQALIMLGGVYFYKWDPAAGAAVAEQAVALESSVSPLERSRARAVLAIFYGQQRRDKESISLAESAAEIFPEQPERDPGFLYSGTTSASLAKNRSLAFIALAGQWPARGYQTKAAQIFASMGKAGLDSAPDRIRCQIFNGQAHVAVMLNDLDAFESYMSKGAEGVALLGGSHQRRRELWVAYAAALRQWPQEPRITELGQRLELTPGDGGHARPGAEAGTE